MHVDGHLESEVAQKLGIASQEFKTLRRIWNHCNISRSFKFVIFTACILQRLLYSLDTAWLNKSLRRKLDGFHAKCLRQILQISPSFMSRVSNEFILRQFDTVPLSKILLQRQLELFGNIARLPNDHILRKITFEENSLQPISCRNRRRGRPRSTWTEEIAKIASSLFHDEGRLWHSVMNPDSWKQIVKHYASHVDIA